MRAVLDPSVLISSLIAPQGPSAELVRAWRTGYFRLVVSPDLIDEFEDVISRDRFRQWFSVEAGRDLAMGIFTTAERVRDPANPAKRCRDPNDDYLIELALAAEADLVSVDRDLLDVEKPPVLITSPGRYLVRLEREV